MVYVKYLEKNMTTNRKRVQAYVNHATYNFLKSEAESRNISLSEYVADILQTYDVSSDSSSMANFVTKRELEKLYEEIQKEMIREIHNAVSRSEAHWEAMATSLTQIQSETMKMISEELPLSEMLKKDTTK